MSGDHWVRSLGLDADGCLFVEIDIGIRIYDLCLGERLPHAINIRPEDLMRPENRNLYYCFLKTLKEIEAVIYNSQYDAGYRFKRGDVVVDAGARVGTFAAKISGAVGNEGRIVAIEPEPRNYYCLRRNIEANRLDNVTAVQKMLWSRAQPLDLFLSGDSSAHSAYRGEFYGSTGASLRTDADTLDAILDELGVHAVDFIKMDIEGSEGEALEGMKKTLESNVQLAIAAYHPVEGRLTYSDIVPLLRKLGFEAEYGEGIVHARR